MVTGNKTAWHYHLTWSQRAETSWGCSVRPHGPYATACSIQARPRGVDPDPPISKNGTGPPARTVVAGAIKIGTFKELDEIAKAAKPHRDRIKIALLVAVRI